jgi:hypothetical protein
MIHTWSPLPSSFPPLYVNFPCSLTSWYCSCISAYCRMLVSCSWFCCFIKTLHLLLTHCPIITCRRTVARKNSLERLECREEPRSKFLYIFHTDLRVLIAYSSCSCHNMDFIFCIPTYLHNTTDWLKRIKRERYSKNELLTRHTC